jgi:hypothetical protein
MMSDTPSSNTKTDTPSSNTTLTSTSRFLKLFRPSDMYEEIYKGKPISDQKDGVPEIVPFLRLWVRKAKELRISQISLGFLATFFSILTATSISFPLSDYYSKYFAFIAAVSIGLMTAFDLGTKSNHMTDAWRHLVVAVVKFNRGVYKKEDVINAYEEGERTIGDVTYQQTGGQIRPRTPASGSTGTPT